MHMMHVIQTQEKPVKLGQAAQPIEQVGWGTTEAQSHPFWDLQRGGGPLVDTILDHKERAALVGHTSPFQPVCDQIPIPEALADDG